VGGGNWPHPGEISLAHRGVLFLDELPEFGPRVLEVMRQPIEDKLVTISRAQGRLTFPANFQLVAAMNPCPCGYYGDLVRPCTCSPGLVTKYQKRISGPLLDRIDIHIEVPRVEFDKLSDKRLGEPSDAIQRRVEAARALQRGRFGETKPIPPEPDADVAEEQAPLKARPNKLAEVLCNADMRPAEVRKFCELDDTSRTLMKSAAQQLQLSARAYHRILKLSRTIADLAGSETIQPQHLAEALQYRPKVMLEG
jgi:magnesium chelatase family protein